MKITLARVLTKAEKFKNEKRKQKKKNEVKNEF